MFRPLLLAAAFTLPTLAWADAPRVVTDIGPVESLVAMVMRDQGTPERLLQPGASPHHMALRPSQARALSKADVVIWIGPDLTPQLAPQIETLAGSAMSLPLAEQAGVHLLPARDTGLFPHDHDDHEDHEDDHHDEHDEHGHDDNHGDHGLHDPHVWLSPENATLWLTQIADTLAKADPDNAETYSANAKLAIAQLAEAEDEARALLAPLHDRSLAVAHDAYQYFEAHFGLTVLGAISDAEANTPGPARMAALRDGLVQDQPACLLIEPDTDPRLLDIVKSADVPTAILDPMGTELPQGAALYPALIRDIALRIADCAGR